VVRVRLELDPAYRRQDRHVPVRVQAGLRADLANAMFLAE